MLLGDSATVQNLPIPTKTLLNVGCCVITAAAGGVIFKGNLSNVVVFSLKSILSMLPLSEIHIKGSMQMIRLTRDKEKH